MSALIFLDDITTRIRDRKILANTTWKIFPGQNWAVIGPNGSGKSSLVKVITGELPCISGRIVKSRPSRGPDSENALKIGLVSFETAERTIVRDRRRDHARYFAGNPDARTTIRMMFDQKGYENDVFDLSALMDKPVRDISNGELRKVLIARELSGNPDIIILDEPFDGLDIAAGKDLRKQLSKLVRNGLQLILVTHRFEEIIPEITHVAGVRDGRILFNNVREKILRPHHIKSLYGDTKPCGSPPNPPNLKPVFPELKTYIELINVRVAYQGQTPLKNINWTVRPGENWAVTGPNGSGKTTLMKVIFGEHPQAYANHITLFGHRRGTGESVQDIKKHIGYVSAEFQIRYDKPVTVLDAVLSGFYDSVGLYRCPTKDRKEISGQWLRQLNLSHLAQTPVTRISCGEKRLVLLARAMVKSPLLLILDEPCQGLDPIRRKQMLTLINTIGKSERTQLIFITHHGDETPKCITHRMELPGYGGESPTRSSKTAGDG